MFKVIMRVLLLIIVTGLAAWAIYWLGQRQAAASPLGSEFEGGRPPFAQGLERPSFERFERREGLDEREGHFSLTRGLVGVLGNLMVVAIIVAITVGIGKATRLALVSAPLPKNGIIAKSDER